MELLSLKMVLEISLVKKPLKLSKNGKNVVPKLINFSEIVKGSNLIKADKSTKPIDEVLAGKDIILIYFSGHWCPPCRRFTPVLKKFYDENAGQGIELIFVSSDKSSEDMLNYMK